MALAQSPMPLHQGPAVGWELNEMAAKHFQCPACVTAVLEDSRGCVTQLWRQEVTAWLCSSSLASQGRACAMRENMDGREREESPKHPLCPGCVFRKEKILCLVPGCLSSNTHAFCHLPTWVVCFKLDDALYLSTGVSQVVVPCSGMASGTWQAGGMALGS